MCMAFLWSQTQPQHYFTLRMFSPANGVHLGVRDSLFSLMIFEYLFHGKHFSRDWDIMVATKLSTRFLPYWNLHSSIGTQMCKRVTTAMRKIKQGKGVGDGMVVGSFLHFQFQQQERSRRWNYTYQHKKTRPSPDALLKGNISTSSSLTYSYPWVKKCKCNRFMWILKAHKNMHFGVGF